MALDSLLSNAHYYLNQRSRYPNEKFYLNLGGASTQSWVGTKQALGFKNRAAWRTLVKMVEMLPDLMAAYRDNKEMQQKNGRVGELATTILIIVAGVQDKVDSRECKLCSYVYLTRVERKQDALLKTLSQLPLSHYEQLVEEQFPIQRDDDQAQEVSKEIKGLVFPMPDQLQTPSNIQAFEKEKKILIFKIGILRALWVMDGIINDYDSWSGKKLDHQKVLDDMEEFYDRREKYVRELPAFLFTKCMLLFSLKASRIDFMIEGSRFKLIGKCISARFKQLL